MVLRVAIGSLAIVLAAITVISTGHSQSSAEQLGGLTGLQPTGLDLPQNKDAHWRIAKISQINGDKSTTYVNARSGYPWPTVWTNDTKDIYTLDEIDKLFVQKQTLGEMLTKHDDALQGQMLTQLNGAVVDKYMTSSQAQNIQDEVRKELTKQFQKEIEDLKKQIDVLRQEVAKCRGQ